MNLRTIDSAGRNGHGIYALLDHEHEAQCNQRSREGANAIARSEQRLLQVSDQVLDVLDPC